MAILSYLLVDAHQDMDEEMFKAFQLFYEQYSKSRRTGEPSGAAAIGSSVSVSDSNPREPSGTTTDLDTSLDVAVAGPSSSAGQGSGSHAEEDLPPDRPDKYAAEEYLSRNRKFTAAKSVFRVSYCLINVCFTSSQQCSAAHIKGGCSRGKGVG